MEPIDVYDRNGKRTGRVIDRYSASEDDYRLVAHVCVFDGTGRMLVQKRSAAKSSLPGYWDISAGGQVDAGESSAQGASRELFEELGLKRRFYYDDRVCTVRFRYGFDDYYITGRRNDDSLRLQVEEVSEAMWCTVSEIESMIDGGIFIRYRKEFLRSLFDAYYQYVPMKSDLDFTEAFDAFDRYVDVRHGGCAADN